MKHDRIAVLLHGFLRTGAAMERIGRRLRDEGYREVVAPTFRYHEAPLDEHAERADDILREVQDTYPRAQVDVVTHSYGGVLARTALARPGAPRPRRVVMLSPPNQGAQWADMIRRTLPVHRLGWDPLHQFLPGVPARRPVPDTEVGVLTGGLGHPRGFNPLLGGDNDGTVRVDEAWLEGARDFHVVPVHHSFMPLAGSSLEQVVHFLRTGRFRRQP